MVKFGGVRNYLVATWDPEDLAACADLNLPCADVTALLPEPMDKAKDAGLTGSHDYLVSLCLLVMHAAALSSSVCGLNATLA
jgi:hypothetical protein